MSFTNLISPILLQKIYFWIVYLFLIECLSQHAYGNQAECFIKTSTSKVIRNNDTCIVKYSTEGCLDGDEYPELENIGNESVEIFEERKDNISASLNIEFRLLTSGTTLLLINGITTSNETRCVLVIFNHVHVIPEQPIVLHLQKLVLSHGVYNLTGIHTLSELQTRTGIDSQSLENSQYETRVTHQAFNVPMMKRHRRVDNDCLCNGCLRTSYEFYPESGLLRFYYNLTNTKCKFTVTLFSYKNPALQLDASTCSLLPVDADTLRFLSIEVSRDKDTFPIDFANLKRGCYTIKTLNGLFSPFFWLNTTNDVDMELWNTTIVLTARNAEASLEVKWDYPDFPFNFTSFQLTLWHLKNYEVRCEGENNQNEWVETINTEEPILTTNLYTFTNLTTGFYCVRLFPIDYRCPRDGCTPRSSRTVRLSEFKMEIGKVEKVESNNGWKITTLIIISAIIGGVCFAILLFILYHRGFWDHRHTYSSVEHDHCFKLEPVSVLLIWTRYTMRKDVDVEPVVRVFRDLLRNYSKCKVFDYLDKSSLDKKQRQNLISHPTEWLCTHLKDTKVKIILIETEGAKYRQSARKEKLYCEDSLDEHLFPFVLRYLNDSKDLASDYSRIFLVRFSDLNASDIDLEGIVPCMRFTIPKHMRSLTLKMRGLSEEVGTDFPLPAREKLQEFESAIKLVEMNCDNAASIEGGSIYCPT